LPGFKEEAFAKFEKELLQLVDDCGFEIGLGIAGPLLQAKKFQHERRSEDIGRLLNSLAFRCQFAGAAGAQR